MLKVIYGQGAEEATNRSSPPPGLLRAHSHNLSLPVRFPFCLSRHCYNLILPIYLNKTISEGGWLQENMDTLCLT